jgi:hypothetical protein
VLKLQHQSFSRQKRPPKAFTVLPDAKNSLWPFLPQKMPKSVEKEKIP